MEDAGKNALSRRAALRRLFGAEARKRLRTTALVEEYRSVLREVVRELPFGVSRERLPASVSVIAEAVVEVASGSLMDLPRGTLREAYASLAFFCEAAEAEVLQRGKADFDRQDSSPEARERIRVAFERRKLLLSEQVRLRHEFEQRVPSPPPRS